MSISENRVCVICGKQEAVDDALEKDRPVHRSCVLFGRQMLVTTRFLVERKSKLLQRDEGLQLAFDEVQTAPSVSIFRRALEGLGRYVLEFKDKIEKVIASYRAQRTIDDRATKRLSIMEEAVEQLCEAFTLLQMIAEEHLLERFDPARLLGRPVRDRELTFEFPEATALAG